MFETTNPIYKMDIMKYPYIYIYINAHAHIYIYTHIIRIFTGFLVSQCCQCGIAVLVETAPTWLHAYFYGFNHCSIKGHTRNMVGKQI